VPSERASEEMVLGFLVEGGDEFTSGEALSDKLGLSRAAIWKNVASLRTQGYEIEALAGRGYRLVGVPDRLTQLELTPLVSTHDIGRTVHFQEVAPSTSDVAFTLANEGALHGEVVIAEHQTRGRGRRGRTWISPPGKNLYISVILRPELAPQDAPQLTFVAAVATAETVREAGCEAWLKWPNDVEIRGRKVAGILTELSAEPGRVNFVVVGIGVNLNAASSDFPAEVRDRATSILIERGSPVPRALFTAALCARLETWYDRLIEDGFEAILDRWRELTSTLGSPLRVTLGDRTVVGTAEDVDPHGALMVRDDAAHLHRVVAGDVEHLEKASPGNVEAPSSHPKNERETGGTSQNP
jgi:BirA family transcriptional regulator, biotin operon repressor / biotin---[acetyl-CoA-carboxylase] ligase